MSHWVSVAVSISLLACTMDRDPPAPSRTFDVRLLRRFENSADLRYAVAWVHRDQSLVFSADRPLDPETLEFEVEFVIPQGLETSELSFPRTLSFQDRSWVWAYQPRLLVYRDVDRDQTLRLHASDADGGSVDDELLAVDHPVGGSVAFIPDVARQVEMLTAQGRIEYYQHTGDRLTPFVVTYESNAELALVSTFSGLYVSTDAESRLLENVRCSRSVASLPNETHRALYIDDGTDAEVLCETTNDPCTTIDLDNLPKELADALASVESLFGAMGDSNAETSVDAGTSQPEDPSETDAGETDASQADAGETDASQADAGETDAGLSPDVADPMVPSADSIAQCQRSGSLVTLVVNSAAEPICVNCACATPVSQQVFIASEAAAPAWWPCGNRLRYCDTENSLDLNASCSNQPLDSR